MMNAERPITFTHANGDRVRGLLFHNPSDAPNANNLMGAYLPGFRATKDGEKSQALARHAIDHGWSWLRFDPRGVGDSDGPFAQLTMSRYLADTGLALSHFAPSKFILVGSSMGGWLATLAAAYWPERVHALVLIAPAYNWIQKLFLALPEHERQAWQDTGNKTFTCPYSGEVYTLDFTIVADAWRHDLLRWPPTLHCPVHILHGDTDEAVSPAVSADFAASAHCPQVTRELLAGVDHRLTGQQAKLISTVAHYFDPPSGTAKEA